MRTLKNRDRRLGSRAVLGMVAFVMAGTSAGASAADKKAPSAPATPSTQAPSANSHPMDPSSASGASGASGDGAEEVQIEKIKTKYWAGGDEAQVGVVQNRAFSKAHRWVLGVQGGFLFNDPFLDNKAVGGVIGYHFNEYLGFEAVAWKLFSSSSSANDKLSSPPNPKTANTNPPRSFFGGEFLWSMLYGKLSLVGKKIIYYDMHLITGGGLTTTETGKDPTGILGVGQRFYIGKSTSIRFDYRFVAYKEDIKEKEIPAQMGQVVGSRWNMGHSLVLGLDFMFGGGGK